MFFNKLREIVEARRCGWPVSLLRLCSKPGLYLPMARVRNRNPTIKPRYPTKGRIHMAATEELGLPLEGVLHLTMVRGDVRRMKMYSDRASLLRCLCWNPVL